MTITSYPGGGDLLKVADFLSRKDEDGNLIPFCYDNVIPQPPEVLESLEHGGGDEDWYDWRVTNWGTKWDNTDDVYTELSDECLYYSFDSPWGPPRPVTHELSKKFEHIVISHAWDEPGGDFGGYILLHRGVILKDRTGESRMASYHDLASYALDSVGYLIEQFQTEQEDLPLSTQ